MKVKHIVFIVILLAIGGDIYGQTITSSSFTDKYWGYYFDYGYNPSQVASLDTFNLVLCKDAKAMYSGNFHGGVMFHADGSFENFRIITCGDYNKKMLGSWFVEDDIIVVNMPDRSRFFFKPGVIFNGKTVLKQWFVMH